MEEKEEKKTTAWFTADWHLGHENIIKYCDRPFKTARQMDRTIIKRYCERVKPEDTVFFIGDLSMKRRNYKEWYIDTFSKLPGTKHLILGNHDTLNPFDYVEAGFTSVHTALDIGDFILAHDPAVATVDINRKFICGHVHRLFRRCGNVVNVGVDIWDFKPVSMDIIKEWLFDEDFKGDAE